MGMVAVPAERPPGDGGRPCGRMAGVVSEGGQGDAEALVAGPVEGDAVMLKFLLTSPRGKIPCHLGPPRPGAVAG